MRARTTCCDKTHEIQACRCSWGPNCGEISVCQAGNRNTVNNSKSAELQCRRETRQRRLCRSMSLSSARPTTSAQNKEATAIAQI